MRKETTNKICDIIIIKKINHFVWYKYDQNEYIWSKTIKTIYNSVKRKILYQTAIQDNIVNIYCVQLNGKD